MMNASVNPEKEITPKQKLRRKYQKPRLMNLVAMLKCPCELQSAHFIVCVFWII